MQPKYSLSIRSMFIILILISFQFVTFFSPSSPAIAGDGENEIHPQGELRADQGLYLPFISRARPNGFSIHPASIQRVNVPYFKGDILYPETAIFWFGKVTPTENFAQVRVGFNQQELSINLAAFDRQQWFDTNPSPAALTEWDAVTLYLAIQDGNTYRFVGQFDNSSDNDEKVRANYQAVYSKQGSSWSADTVPFSTRTAWRGTATNDNAAEDRGWVITFKIPFESLGFSVRPEDGTSWKMGVVLHDRDDASGSPIPDQLWPRDFTVDSTSTWGELVFGIPTYDSPVISQAETILIRHKLNGAVVVDGEVGGGSICGGRLDYWTEWGDKSYPGSQDNSDFNIQNQSDIADWPCFARYYVTFALESLPKGKAIASAKLTLHQMGNSGGGSWGEAGKSLIQIFTVGEDWDEATLTWNNSPHALENVSSAWVYPVEEFPGWPGIPWSWDISRAVAQAYTAGEPLRLAIYTADNAYHSGKYFVSSDTGDWNAEARPEIEIRLGNP
jgi:hypothetical protein